MLDLATVPVEVWADWLEEHKACDTMELRLWAEYGCFTCTQQDSWSVYKDRGISLEGHTSLEGIAHGNGAILTYVEDEQEEVTWERWWSCSFDRERMLGKSIYAD